MSLYIFNNKKSLIIKINKFFISKIIKKIVLVSKKYFSLKRKSYEKV